MFLANRQGQSRYEVCVFFQYLIFILRLTEAIQLSYKTKACLIAWGYSFLCSMTFFTHADLPPNSIMSISNDLVEWVSSSAPVGEEQAQADGIEESSNNADCNHVERSLFSNDSSDNLTMLAMYATMIHWRTYAWSSRGEEDQRTEVSCTLVAQSASGIDQGGNTISLNSGTNNR